MSKLVELEYGIVQIRERKVRCDNVGVGVVCGVLNRGKIVNIILRGNYDDTARVLSCGLFYAHAILDKSVHFGTWQTDALLFHKLGNVTVCGLIGKRAERARTEHVTFTKQLLGVFVDSTLDVTREVEVNIGGFVAVEAKEGLEHNIVTVSHILCSALGAIFVGQVKARANRAIGEELVMLTFGIGAIIVRRQGVYLGDTCHSRGKGRADRATRADKIALVLAILYQALCDEVKYREAVFHDGIKLTRKTL